MINALLQGKVLPAGIGHTTSCFCSVTGSESEEGYLLTPGSEEKQNVKVSDMIDYHMLNVSRETYGYNDSVHSYVCIHYSK